MEKTQILMLVLLCACQPATQERKENVHKVRRDTPIQARPVATNEATAMNTRMDSLRRLRTGDASSARGLGAIIRRLQQKDSVQIVCYGNSITRGYKVGSYGTVERPYPLVWAEALREHYPNASLKVHNEGHNGWRSDQALRNIARLVLPRKPHLVVLEFGINDAYSGFSEAVFVSQMRQIITVLHNQNITPLVLAPTPINTAYEAQVRRYATALAKLCQQTNTAFFNLHDAVIERTLAQQSSLAAVLPDDVHFADDKYAWIAEEIQAWWLRIKESD